MRFPLCRKMVYLGNVRQGWLKETSKVTDTSRAQTVSILEDER